MKELLSLRFPLEKEGMTTVRLATGGVCSQLGFDLDASEDCKVCVTESLLLLMHAGYACAELVFASENGLHVRVSGDGQGLGTACEEDDISFALLGALAYGVNTEKREGRLQSVSFRFGN